MNEQATMWGNIRSALAAPDEALPEALMQALDSVPQRQLPEVRDYLRSWSHRWDPRTEAVPFASLVAAWMNAKHLCLLECIDGFDHDLLKALREHGPPVLQEALEWAHWGSLGPHAEVRLCARSAEEFKQWCQTLSSISLSSSPVPEVVEMGTSWQANGVWLDRAYVEIEWFGAVWLDTLVTFGIVEGEPWDDEQLMSLFEVIRGAAHGFIEGYIEAPHPCNAYALYNRLRDSGR